MAADQTVAVPDVVGFDAIDASEMVQAAGLVPHGPEFTPAPTDGVVIAQEPEPASAAAPASPVVLWTQQDRRLAADMVPDPAGSRAPEPV